MYLAGIPANLLSLGAIDFGIVVDGSLVMVEHIVHRLRSANAKAGSGQAPRAVQAAALEMAQPIFFSLAIIVAAYIPLFTMQRVERRLFGPMAFKGERAARLADTVADADPGAGRRFFRRGAKSWENPAQRIAGRYEQLLRGALRRAALTVSVALALVAASFCLPARSARSSCRSSTRA